MKLINLEKAIGYAKEKDYIRTSGQEEAMREVFAFATVEAVPINVFDKIKGYIDHIRNTGMGKKKSLDFIEKFIEGLKAESEDKE